MPERDPDELLEVFERITADASRPASPLPRRSLISRLAVAAVLGVVIAGLAGAAMLYGPRLMPAAPTERVELLTHTMTDLSSVGTHTGIAGIRITRSGSCLYIAVPERRWLTIWPTGTYLDESTEPPAIRDADGNRITMVGDTFSLTGASVSGDAVDQVRSYLEGDIPDACAGTLLMLIEPGTRALRPEVATWRIDPAKPPEPSSTTLNIEIQENACSSRADPRGRTLPPAFHYGADEVVITLSILEIGGRCPGNPYFPMTIELSEPLGHRSLVDGYDSGLRWRPGVGPSIEQGLDGSPTTSPSPPTMASIPMCDSLPSLTAPAERYDDSRASGLGTDELTERARSWASTRPGFQGIWIDREQHDGWITLAFTGDDEARQAEVVEAFPNDTVVVVGVDWTRAELDALLRRVREELESVIWAVGIPLNKGVVDIRVEHDGVEAVQERFAGERVCVDVGGPFVTLPEIQTPIPTSS